MVNRKSKIPKWSRETCKIIAWIVASEGSIGIYKSRKTLCPHISVDNTATDFLKGLVKLTGVNQISKHNEPPEENWKDTYKWYLSSQIDVLDCLQRIKPYLPIKKEQADLVQKFCKSRISRLKGKRPNDVPYSQQEISLWVKCKELNMRGRRGKSR